MPVSIVIASFGVDGGTWRILCMMLFMIVCILWLSLCVVVLLSAPYVIIGMMHVSTSFHIIAIFSPLKFLSFAMWSSHLDGDALNVALLVPESRRVVPGFLIKSLSDHCN